MWWELLSFYRHQVLLNGNAISSNIPEPRQLAVYLAFGRSAGPESARLARTGTGFLRLTNEHVVAVEAPRHVIAG